MLGGGPPATGGRLDDGRGILEHAFTLGCSVNDACWEAYSARGLGLLAAARGDLDGRSRYLDDALRRCARERDTHRWIRAYVARRALRGRDRGRRPAGRVPGRRDLAAFAGSGGMAEFSVRAYLYRAELGEPGARDAARALIVGVENPRLAAALDAGASPLFADLVAAR